MPFSKQELDLAIHLLDTKKSPVEFLQSLAPFRQQLLAVGVPGAQMVEARRLVTPILKRDEDAKQTSSYRLIFLTELIAMETYCQVEALLQRRCTKEQCSSLKNDEGQHNVAQFPHCPRQREQKNGPPKNILSTEDNSVKTNLQIDGVDKKRTR